MQSDQDGDAKCYERRAKISVPESRDGIEDADEIRKYIGLLDLANGL
ncbi:hypothetical protein [Bradyrhizobium sp. 187]|nr:hypothetical protein [Bradyrhizobium sp. 187]UPJ76827.1 hypothetical protein IVB19_38745 [Bradyrhizobium sp. 187]